MEQKHFPKGLDDRMRDANGEIRHKRGDTQIGTLRAKYGASFAQGYPDSADLQTVLEKEGVASLDQLLKK